jgi:1,4-dihydroxy-2-naphthoate octaprenyltransferase
MTPPKLKVWIDSARPKTLFAAVGPVMIGAAMAFSDGDIHVITLIVTLITAVLIQIGTNFANDYYDFVKGADTSQRTGPTRATQAGLVTPAKMKKAFITTFGLTLLLGAYLVLKGGTPILIIGIASVLCGILYTAGPLPIGYIGLGDLFVLIFFGPVAVGGTYYLQTKAINANVLIAGLAPGLIASAILTVNNLRDFATDKIAGKKTLVVRFGLRFGLTEYLFCVIGACLVPVYLCISSGSHFYSLLAFLTLIAAWGPIKTVCSKPTAQALNEVLAQTARLLIIFSLLFSIGWII